MPKPPKRLDEYENPPFKYVDEAEFNSSVLNDMVHYTCTCGEKVRSTKRLIAARILHKKPLLCTKCKNRKNATKKST